MKTLQKLALAALCCTATLTASAAINDDVVFNGTPDNAKLDEFPVDVWRVLRYVKPDDDEAPRVKMIEGRKVLWRGTESNVVEPLFLDEDDEPLREYLPEAFTVEWDLYIDEQGKDNQYMWFELDLMNYDEAYADWDHLVADFKVTTSNENGWVNDEIGWVDMAEEYSDYEVFEYGGKGEGPVAAPYKQNAWNHYVLQYSNGTLRHTLNDVVVTEKHNVPVAKAMQIKLEGTYDKTALSNFIIRKGAK